MQHLRLIAIAVLMLVPFSAHAQPADVTVFAAASLKNALDEIAGAFQKHTGKRVAVSYAASSALARQIEQGAPADIFISADLDWMDYLEQRRLIRAEMRRNLVGNRIVLIAPADGARAVELVPGALAGALGGGRLATAAVASVPAGKYAKAALGRLGLWTEVAGRLAEAENVRAALSFVARGEAPLGIVYESDAKSEPRIRVVARFPETSHPPIVYPVALTQGSKSEDAKRLLDALRTPASASVLTREGFVPLD